MKKIKNFQFLILLLLGIAFFSCTTEKTQKYPTKILEFDSTKAAELAQKIRNEVSVEMADGLELSLWASDSLVQDPVAISVAPNGQIYYARSKRLTNSEFDIRGHRDWMVASISFQTVEDRRAFLRKTFADENEDSKKFLKDLNEDGVRDWKDLTVEKEEIWFVEDKSGNGFADRAQMYLQDFSEEITDLANGVEFHNGEVYISVGPDLWRTKDEDGDGIADWTQSISHGFAVHIGFGAHGMSGVTTGPDGRIWWGIGDIGMNVIDQEGKQWKYPNRGVVVRAEPDGSNFEVFAMGVRNTHEFVFDKYGNVISVDNDGDHSGERERLVYLIDGSDTGWRINWQFGKYTDPDNNSYKVWMDEKMHLPRWEGQAAYILPPIMNYVNGPTGMVYNPGTALGPAWKDHFFIAEFRGGPAISPIHAFTLKQDGAGYALDTTMEVMKGLLPTGLDFGPDGALYFGDWINGWSTKNEGRIWKLDMPTEKDSDIRKETKRLIQEDFSKVDFPKLKACLAHRDMRVRQKAQFELVKRGEKGYNTFVEILQNSGYRLARVHAMWGIAQLARNGEVEKAKVLIPHLKDKDLEICAQAAKMLGDVKYKPAASILVAALKNMNPRVQMFCAEALGRIGEQNAVIPILKMLEKNDGKDAWLRAAGMIALGRIGRASPLVALKDSGSKSQRTVAVVALRRMENPAIAEFLNDPDEYIVTEAARGINDDFSIEEALPALANVLKETRFTAEALLRRAINANLRVGKKENIDLLIQFANRKSAPAEMRAEAIEALSTWAKPSVFDRVDGRYRGVIEREGSVAKNAFLKIVNTLLQDNNSAIQKATVNAIARMGIAEKSPELLALIGKSKNAAVRNSILIALNKLNANELETALEIALKDNDNSVRSKALEILPDSKIEESKAVLLFGKIIKDGSVKEQQAAFTALQKFKGKAAYNLMGKYLDQLIQGKLKPELKLDVVVAVEKYGDSQLLEKLKVYQAAKPKNDPLSLFRETLAGGDIKKGEYVFYNNEAAQCTKCHAIFEYGGNAGPGLEGAGKRLSKEQILASLVTPSSEYAIGYEVVLITLKDGTSEAGIVMERTEEYVKLKLGKEDIRTIPQIEIAESQSLPSSMLPMGTVLKKKEIRDLVAFLKNI
ncbi:MAG: putative membrane-bound dehydrogenase-like protein [Granulosicoccus sp.]|jgi:putative membrane-bound dehydrogenase-like protein